MKNRLPFAAMTFAFTVAGSCIGYALHDMVMGLVSVTLFIATVGAFAAALSGEQL